MTTAIQKRTIFDALIFEPIELVISQPHQALISSASVFLVAAEAGKLVDWPFNVLLGIGAEWAYLKGLSSGQQVRTRWATALNWSAVILVVLYGSLWGLRKFGAIPETPPVWGAVLLTLIHILCIGAVTICSAMVHSAMLAEQRCERERKQATEEARSRRLQDQQDAIERDQARARVELEIELAKKRADLEIWQAGQQAKQMLRANAPMRSASKKMRGDAHPESMNADEKICPKCQTVLAHPQWLAARRWGRCANCKEVS